MGEHPLVDPITGRVDDHGGAVLRGTPHVERDLVVGGDAYLAARGARELGSMRVTEQLDAMKAMGSNPIRVLVVPRVLALVVSLPLLVFVGDLAGLDIGVVGPRGKVGVVGAATGDVAFEVRAFFHTGDTVSEDPVTGSLNAALAQWLIGEGLAPPVYVAAQGTAMGRAGRVHVRQEGDDIWIGGDSVTCIDGTVAL